MQQRMTRHGIFTTSALCWAHLFPFECKLFYYRVADCVAHINSTNPPLVPGYSRNGIITGQGYLIRKYKKFVRCRRIDPRRLDCYDWNNGTNRQTGKHWGESLVCLWATFGVFGFEPKDVVVYGIREQFCAVDFGMLRNGAWEKWEIKTETIRDTPNLFVQESERNHDPNLLPDGSRRWTPL